MTSDPQMENRERPVDIRARMYNEATAEFKKQEKLAQQEKAGKLEQIGTEKD